MVTRSRSFWITLLLSWFLVESSAFGEGPHRRPGHAPAHASSHGAPGSHHPSHTASHVGSGHVPAPHASLRKTFRFRNRSAFRSSRFRSGRSSGLRSSIRSRGFRSLPRAAYPTDLRGPTEVDGRFLRPIDGDTFAMNGVKIRLNGIDAPELGTPGGGEAAVRLAAMLQEGQVTIVPRSRDVYGRTVADVFLNGQNLAERLIEEGYGRRG